MNYIKLSDESYPHTEANIKSENPNTSYPDPFNPGSGYALVFQAPQPEYDPVVQNVEERQPVLTNKGHYEQMWTVVSRFTPYTDENGVHHTVKEQEDAARELDRKSRVPQVVSIRQARLALNRAELLAKIPVAMDTLQEPARTEALIEWEYSSEVRRDWPALVQLLPALGLNEKQVDDLFIEASKL